MDQILGPMKDGLLEKIDHFLTKTSQKKLNIGKRMLESISLIKVANKLDRNLGSADFFGSWPFFRPEISARLKKSLFLDVGVLPPAFIFFKNDNHVSLSTRKNVLCILRNLHRVKM